MNYTPRTRVLLPILSLFLAFTMLAFQHDENQQQNKEKEIQYGVHVVELFTSQGCSSCPAADDLLVKIKGLDNVITLSYHVDYWNYLGWKDPYSDKAFSAYQRQYAKQLNSGVYTPQMVVNGKNEFVGSKEQTLKNAISTKSMVSGLPAPKIDRSRNTVDFTYDTSSASRASDIYALLVMDQEITKVSKGENANKNLKNSNIVIQRKVIGNTKDGKEQFSIPENSKNRYRVTLVAHDKNLELVAAGISSLE